MSLCHHGALTALLLCGLAGAITFQVELKMPRYVLAGESATLRCAHSVSPQQLRKVEWLKGNAKIFQFIKGRTPPFRSHGTPGAVLDEGSSDETRVVLRNLSHEASGLYSCEVSTETPIYTKPSNDEELTVVVPQQRDPVVSVRRGSYSAGEVLEANCTSSPARPVPHVAWFVDGRLANESHTRLIPDQRNSVSGSRDNHLSSATMQLTMAVTQESAREDRQLELLCVSSIPAFQGPNAGQTAYIDKRYTTIAVELATPQNSAVRNATPSSSVRPSSCAAMVLVAAWASRASRAILQ